MIVARAGAVLLAAMLSAPGVEAQSVETGSAEPAQQRLEFARGRLNLDAAQQRELRALLFDAALRLQEISDKYTALADRGSQADKLREVRDLQQDFRTRLGALLTPEQMSEWDRMGEELRAYARERWPAAGDDDR